MDGSCNGVEREYVALETKEAMLRAVCAVRVGSIGSLRIVYDSIVYDEERFAHEASVPLLPSLLPAWLRQTDALRTNLSSLAKQVDSLPTHTA